MLTRLTTTDLMPPDIPDWATLSRQFVEVRRGREIFRRGYVADVMPDGSGLWMAADGILGRELIWRDQGFTVDLLYRSADGAQPKLDTALSHAPESQAESGVAGGRL